MADAASTSKNVYVVSVSFDTEMFVLAEDEGQAEAIACDNVSDAVDTFDLSSSCSFTARAADPASCRLEDSIPWGDGNDDELTVAELLAEQTEREREAEEAARIEANQLKLPIGGGQ